MRQAIALLNARTTTLEYNPLAMKKRILSISYDEPLLQTRQMLLENAGYDVTSALGYVEALETCTARKNFDLILMGHSMPRKDKTTLINTLRPICEARILSIRRHGDDPLPEADASIDSLDGPHVLLDVVKKILE
jgi:PleD family two-component response regulator